MYVWKGILLCCRSKPSWNAKLFPLIWWDLWSLKIRKRPEYLWKGELVDKFAQYFVSVWFDAYDMIMIDNVLCFIVKNNLNTLPRTPLYILMTWSLLYIRNCHLRHWRSRRTESWNWQRNDFFSRLCLCARKMFVLKDCNMLLVEDVRLSFNWAVRCKFGSGGFFLVCDDFGRMFDHSFPACAFFFWKWR